MVVCLRLAWLSRPSSDHKAKIRALLFDYGKDSFAPLSVPSESKMDFLADSFEMTQAHLKERAVRVDRSQVR